jgi:hypothetical protein
MAKAAKADSRPAQEWTTIVQTGLTGFNLATDYQAQLAGRLDPTLVAALGADLVSLGANVPAAKTAHGSAVAATALQNSALETGAQMASGCRLSVVHGTTDEGIRKSYGVARKMNKLVVKDVVAALQMIINRATAAPAEAAGFGILASDVGRYTKQIDIIAAADQAQEQARAKAPKAVKVRNETGRRILAAVGKIAGAGVIAFDTSPTERAKFEALVKKVK